MTYPAHILQNGTEQSCKEHLLNTAEYASERLSKLNLSNAGYLLGLVHDIGKLSEDFADYIQKAFRGEKVRKGKIIHSFAAVQLLMSRYFKGYEEDSYKSFASELLSVATASHHGLFDCIDDRYNSGLEHRLNKQVSYDEKAIKVFFDEICSQENLDELFFKAQEEICQICGKFEEDMYFYISLLCRTLQSALIDADRTDTARFMQQKPFEKFDTDKVWNDCLNNLNEYLNSFSAETPIQKARKEIADICYSFAKNQTDIYRLNVPTGGGKTFSSLRYALNHAKIYHKSRIIYVAPFLSIIDQNAREIKKALKSDEYILEHHSNIVKNKDDEDYALKQFSEDSWNSPIIITTMVQFLNTLFSEKTSCVRRFQALANSVIIIDEVQSLPTKALSLFNCGANYLSQICNSTLILCSATQPTLENLPHPLKSKPKDIIGENSYKKFIPIFKRTNIVNYGNKSYEEIAELAKDKLQENNSLLIVCNKKTEVLEISNLLKDFCTNTYLLTTSMCVAHRGEVLKEIKDKLGKEKLLCISTQLIEAGIDISFASVIRLQAGIDSIVQAAGRCNRNGESSISDVAVVSLKGENLQYLEEISVSKDACQDLFLDYEKNPKKYENDLASEISIKKYYDRFYSRSKGKNDIFFDYSLKNNTSIFELLSENAKLSSLSIFSDKYCMHQAFKTAGEEFEVLDNKGVSAIVYYKESEELIAELYSKKAITDFNYRNSLIEKLRKYTVNLFPFQVQKLKEKGALTEIGDGSISILDKNNYDPKFGLTIEKENNELCEILIL